MKKFTRVLSFVASAFVLLASAEAGTFSIVSTDMPSTGVATYDPPYPANVVVSANATLVSKGVQTSCSINAWLGQNGGFMASAQAAPRVVWTISWIGTPGETPPTTASCNVKMTGSSSLNIQMAGPPPVFGLFSEIGGTITGWDHLSTGGAVLPPVLYTSTFNDSNDSNVIPLVDNIVHTGAFTLHDATTNEWRATAEQIYLTGVQANFNLDGSPGYKQGTLLGSITQNAVMYKVNNQVV